MAERYLKALDRALEKVPRRVVSGERFEEPKPEIMVFGKSRTMISNFADIARRLNRNPQHILKFLSKEMATAGTYDGQRVYFQGNFARDSIEQLLHIYITRYVVCPICKRPDTKIEKSGRFGTLTCEACGARSPVRPI
ncbi:translation initiation factor IF-2 subunit beta [Candidatus Bathyarchaeota archaeon]|nr:translation initiation factor IF-2 subunit beta [Candidatus Bathyarchaeota archaeon]